MTDAAKGRIVWHELVTPDAEAATDFYREVFGWQAESEDGRRWLSDGGGRVAGVCELPREGEDGEAMESRWLVYVHVGESPEQLGGAVDGALEAGWRALSEPHAERGERGGFAFRLMGGRGHALTVPLAHDNVPPPRDANATPPLGRFCWSQLTVDAERLDAVAADFAALFGWELRRNGGPRGTFASDGVAVAGWHARRAGSEAPDHWLPFVRVADVEATATRAAEHGGRVVVAPSEHPDEKGGLYAVLADPTGGVVGIRGLAG